MSKSPPFGYLLRCKIRSSYPKSPQGYRWSVFSVVYCFHSPMGDCCINHLLSNTMSLLSTVVSLDVENKRKNVDKERSTLPLLTHCTACRRRACVVQVGVIRE